MPEKCLAAHSEDPGACLLPCFSYHYINTPLFIMEAQADSVVLLAHDWVPEIHSKNMISKHVKQVIIVCIVFNYLIVFF